MEIQASSTHKHNRALFLDRDGVILEYVPYLNHPSQVKIPQGAGEALKKWQDAGYLLIVITNQSGIARGYFTISDVEAIHNCMRREYSYFGVKFQDILICPHQPSDICKCRKPSPYMIHRAAELYSIELSQSFFIGDAQSDIECAVNAGCNPILLLTGIGMDTAKSVYDNHKIPIFAGLIETMQIM